MKLAACLAVLIVTATLLAGCAPASVPDGAGKGAYLTGANVAEPQSGSNEIFTLADQPAGAQVGVDFRGTLTQGAVRVQLTGPGAEVVWQAAGTQGTFAVNQVITLPQAGSYRLGLAWDGPVKLDNYDLYWSPDRVEIPAISPLALLSGVGMAAVAIGFGLYARRRGLDGKYLQWGALAWVVAVALKFAWAVPVNPVLYKALQGGLPGWLASGTFYVYVGALTGVFEVALVWLALRFLPVGKGVTWQKALAFGIGFGAVEALLLSLSPLATVISALRNPAGLPLSVLQQVAVLNYPFNSLAPVWERFFTIWIHIFCNALIFYALNKRESRWMWLAFAFKTAIDSFAAWGQVAGLDVPGRLALLEGIVGLFGVAAWLGTRRVEKAFPPVEEAK